MNGATFTEKKVRSSSDTMKYIPALDGLRALAITAVLAHHIFGSHFSGGFIGVDVFFVLSGFLITRLFVIEQESTHTIHLPNFFLRRALRLMPALVVMVTLVLILTWFIHDRSRFQHDAFGVLFALTYTTNYWLGIFTPTVHGLFDNAWSLAVEEQFYIFWGFGAFLLLRFTSRRLTAIVLGILAYLVCAWRWHLLSTGAIPVRIYYGFDTRADQLLIGCLGALLLSTHLAPMIAKMRYVGLVALVALIFVAFNAEAFNAHPMAGLTHFGVIMPTVALLTLALILDLTANDGALSQALSFRPLVYIGSISYGIYLWHWPLLMIAQEGGLNDLLHKVFIGVCVTFVAAALSFHYVERPIRNLKYRFTPRSISPKLEGTGL